MEKYAKIELIGGVEGDSLAINDKRVAGPKPWGGGRVKRTWRMVPVEFIIEAVGKGGAVPALPKERLDEISKDPESATNEEFDALKGLLLSAHDAYERLQRVYKTITRKRYTGYLGRLDRVQTEG